MSSSEILSDRLKPNKPKQNKIESDRIYQLDRNKSLKIKYVLYFVMAAGFTGGFKKVFNFPEKQQEKSTILFLCLVFPNVIIIKRGFGNLIILKSISGKVQVEFKCEINK